MFKPGTACPQRLMRRRLLLRNVDPGECPRAVRRVWCGSVGAAWVVCAGEGW